MISVTSLATLHNLRLFELKTALSEIERVGKQKYIMLESYRTEQELFNLQCWALTAESFFDTAEWIRFIDISVIQATTDSSILNERDANESRYSR